MPSIHTSAGVAGGVAVDGTDIVSGGLLDRIGHGTAVIAAIREKAPQAECHAVRIFDTRLSASAATLLAARSTGPSPSGCTSST